MKIQNTIEIPQIEISKEDLLLGLPNGTYVHQNNCKEIQVRQYKLLDLSNCLHCHSEKNTIHKRYCDAIIKSYDFRHLFLRRYDITFESQYHSWYIICWYSVSYITCSRLNNLLKEIWNFIIIIWNLNNFKIKFEIYKYKLFI